VPAGVTGLVLAGGRGRRLGGADKGLLALHGRPLVVHVRDRLSPQVQALLISANRHAADYAALGVPVLGDAAAGLPPAADGQPRGPLAGMLAGLRHAPTPWLACVPTDAPALPADLVQRLAQAAAQAGAHAALAVTPGAPTLSGRATPPEPGDATDPIDTTDPGDDRSGQPQPVFALLHRSLAGPLAEALAAGDAAVHRVLARLGAVRVRFADAAAFADIDTAQDLAGWPPAGGPDLQVPADTVIVGNRAL
jgi:molybdopterin-guanine dinucleotide biosynthesis protein A